MFDKEGSVNMGESSGLSSALLQQMFCNTLNCRCILLRDSHMFYHCLSVWFSKVTAKLKPLGRVIECRLVHSEHANQPGESIH